MRLDLRFAGFIVLLLRAGSSFAAAPSPDGERLAYSFIGSPENIYLSKADGSAVRPLVARATREFRPEWFPNGKQLLFSAAIEGGPQLFRVDIDGSNLTALTPLDLRASDGHPSPDGTQVVFFRDADDGFDLHVLDLATGAVRNLTETPRFREYAPRWSADGRRILFVGRQDIETPPDIWILDLDSGDRRNVTNTPSGDEFHPAWSRDGRKITFVRVEDGEFAIHIVDLGSGEDVRLALEPGVACFSPHFTPDDRWVTFTRNVFEGTREGLPGVFRVRPDGSDLERLAGVPDTDGEPGQNELTDRRDGQTYATVEIGGMVWMARNLNYAGRESYCYDDRRENCEQNGRLYRWEAALSACPDGWHLSTEFEWQALEIAIGLPFEELEYRGNRGTAEGARLKRDGDLGFDTQYAGWRGYEPREDQGMFRSQGRAAAFWTSTEADLNHAWHRDIDTGDDMIWRSRVVKPYALSVRCVQNRSEYDVDDPNP